MNRQNCLFFGTAGIPGVSISNLPKIKDATTLGICQVSYLGLDAMEIEFVRGIYLKTNKKEQLELIKKTAEDKEIKLSIHCPYYINLNSADQEIVRNSIGYIVNSLIVGQKIGARVAVFHAGYYLKQERMATLNCISRGLERIITEFDRKKEGNGSVGIGIEVTGKETQVGSIEDVFYLYDKYKTNGVVPVIDFSHQHARLNGYFRNKENLNKFFEKLDCYPDYLKNMHIHMSGINYTEKGERNHVMLQDSDLPYGDILKKLKERKACGTVICESPIPYLDAQLLKKEYEKM